MFFQHSSTPKLSSCSLCFSYSAYKSIKLLSVAVWCVFLCCTLLQISLEPYLPELFSVYLNLIYKSIKSSQVQLFFPFQVSLYLIQNILIITGGRHKNDWIGRRWDVTFLKILKFSYFCNTNYFDFHIFIKLLQRTFCWKSTC